MQTNDKKRTKAFQIYPQVDLLEQLRQVAQKNRRSVNQEVLIAIEKHLTQQEQQKPLSP